MLDQYILKRVFLHLSGTSGILHQNAQLSVILFANLKGNLGVREKRCQG